MLINLTKEPRLDTLCTTYFKQQTQVKEFFFLVMWYQHGYFHMYIKINFWFRACILVLTSLEKNLNHPSAFEIWVWQTTIIFSHWVQVDKECLCLSEHACLVHGWERQKQACYPIRSAGEMYRHILLINSTPAKRRCSCHLLGVPAKDKLGRGGIRKCGCDSSCVW